jgi:hypothetical protein
MAVFKMIATWELVVMLVQFLLGNSYLLLPASANAACCSDILFPRLALLSGFFLLTTVAAATILLWVRMAVSSAQAYKKGASLRTLLLLAIGLSATSTFLAIPTYETGYGYRKGCVYSRHPLAVVVMVIMALEHGCAALVAVALD